MAQYTASTSDKLKSVALHKFWISGFGMLPLSYPERDEAIRMYTIWDFIKDEWKTIVVSAATTIAVRLLLGLLLGW